MIELMFWLLLTGFILISILFGIILPFALDECAFIETPILKCVNNHVKWWFE